MIFGPPNWENNVLLPCLSERDWNSTDSVAFSDMQERAAVGLGRPFPSRLCCRL